MTFALPLMFVAGLALSASALAIEPPARPTLYIVGLPAHPSDAVVKESLASIITLATKAQEKDRIVVFDATGQQLLAREDVPQIANARARINRVAPEVAEVRKKIATPTNANASQPVNVIDIPAFLRFVGQLPERRDFGDTRVMMIGSLFTNSRTDATWNFEPGFVPSDGCVGANRADSIFGTADAPKGLLAGTSIVFCPTDQIVDRQLVMVERFYSYYCAALGAPGVTFTPNVTTTVDMIISGQYAPARFDPPLDTSDKFVGIRPIPELKSAAPRVELPPDTAALPQPHSAAAPVASPPPEPVPTPVLGTAAPEAPIPVEAPPAAMVTPIPEIPKPSATGLVVALVWQAPTSAFDLDLYVRDTAGEATDELYYAHKESAAGAGHYLRDIRSTGNTAITGWQSQWECVVMDRASIDTIDVWVDLFSGDARVPVRGFVRVQWADRTIDVPIQFEGQRGDGGSCRANRSANANWIHIDLATAKAHAGPRPGQ